MLSSAVVGALACQVDSYLDTFETVVVNCTQSGKHYELELKDTILFPEDTGTIETEHSSVPVVSIRRALLTALHKVPSPIPPETPVKLVLDWPRRFDHMQQHSGQHLVSAILDQLGVPTLAWNLGESVSYVELPRKLTDEEVLQVEDSCNEVVRRGLDITVEVPHKHLVNTTKLPDDYDTERGILRVVHIGDLDANPCCGTHLKNTKEIGSVALLHQLPIRGSNSRLHFLIGDRVRSYARSANALTRSLNAKLSCQTQDIEAKISKLEIQLRDTTKREKQWMAEIVSIECDRIKSDLRESNKAYVYRPQTYTLDYFNALIAQLGKVDNGTVILACGEGQNGGAVIVLGNQAEAVANRIKQIIEGLKGGGKGLKWQGKVTKWLKHEPAALNSLFQEL